MPHKLGRTGESCGPSGGCPQAPENVWELLKPPANKLVELVEDVRLESLEDHVIRPLNLPINARVSD
jgi:hypothetical protein